jgi:hypothetical protein
MPGAEQMKRNLFAYTAPTGAGYPPYVSINTLESGDVEVIVRGHPVAVEASDELPAHLRQGPTVSAIVPANKWARMNTEPTH